MRLSNSPHTSVKEEPEQTFRFTITPTHPFVVELNPVQFAPDHQGPMTVKEMEAYVEDLLKGSSDIAWDVISTWNLMDEDNYHDFIANATVDIEIV